jgi:hypothetical protein
VRKLRLYRITRRASRRSGESTQSISSSTLRGRDGRDEGDGYTEREGPCRVGTCCSVTEDGTAEPGRVTTELTGKVVDRA